MTHTKLSFSNYALVRFSDWTPWTYHTEGKTKATRSDRFSRIRHHQASDSRKKGARKSQSKRRTQMMTWEWARTALSCRCIQTKSKPRPDLTNQNGSRAFLTIWQRSSMQLRWRYRRSTTSWEPNSKSENSTSKSLKNCSMQSQVEQSKSLWRRALRLTWKANP